MSRYAENTSVSADKSRAEIDKTLTRYGADQFMYGWEDTRAMIGFRMEGRQIRFVLEMPKKEDFRLTPSKKYKRSDADTLKAWEQATRQKWRALALAVKAKLECVESEISTFEEEFMAHIVMPDGKTISEHLTPQIHEAYETGKMPKMLPAFNEE